VVESDDSVVLSFDVAALSVHNLVVTFEHPYSASLMTGYVLSSSSVAALSSSLSVSSLLRSVCYLQLVTAATVWVYNHVGIQSCNLTQHGQI